MLCLKCGKSIKKEFSYCPWCGVELVEKTEIEETPVAELVERVGELKKYQQELRDTQARIAFRAREEFKNKGYLEKYSSFEEFGRRELGMGKTKLFMYKNVGEVFVDEDGNWLVAKGEEWGIGKLAELRPLRKVYPMKLINLLIEDGRFLNPECTLKQVREDVKRLLEECK